MVFFDLAWFDFHQTDRHGLRMLKAKGIINYGAMHPQKVHGQWWSQCLTHATVLIHFLISPLRSWNSSWDLLSFVSPEHSLQQTPGKQVLHWQILLQQGLQQPCTHCLRARSSIFLLKCRCHLTVFQGHSYLNANGKPVTDSNSHNCIEALDPHVSYTPSRPRGPWKRSKNVVLLGGSEGLEETTIMPQEHAPQN